MEQRDPPMIRREQPCSGTQITLTQNEKRFLKKCIISITLPDGIKSIDNYAFSGCTSLVSINIPCSVTSIGEEAFYNCSGLEDVIISDSVETIGVKAFSLCENLKSVIIGKNVNF